MTPLLNRLAHGFENGADLRFQNLGGDPGLAPGFAQDCRVGVALNGDPLQRDVESRNPPDAGDERTHVDAASVAQ